MFANDNATPLNGTSGKPGIEGLTTLYDCFHVCSSTSLLNRLLA